MDLNDQTEMKKEDERGKNWSVTVRMRSALLNQPFQQIDHALSIWAIAESQAMCLGGDVRPNISADVLPDRVVLGSCPGSYPNSPMDWAKF